MGTLAVPGTTVTSPPDTCPFCRSHDVTTTSKSIDEKTYWRCGACGQIWNPSRLAPPRWR
jgi:transposase-like protein